MTRFLFAAVLSWACALSAGAAEAPWVQVDTRAGILSVMNGDRVLKNFDGISIGQGGVSEIRSRGDLTTPLGEFRIAWVGDKSAFHRFFAFDFPRREDADRAWIEGRIDEDTYRAIVRAHRSGARPPQDTPLGGYLGIHGLGAADPDLHERFNWTRGCIALSNEQIDQLAPWIAVGTRVVIK